MNTRPKVQRNLTVSLIYNKITFCGVGVLFYEDRAGGHESATTVSSNAQDIAFMKGAVDSLRSFNHYNLV